MACLSRKEVMNRPSVGTVQMTMRARTAALMATLDQVMRLIAAASDRPAAELPEVVPHDRRHGDQEDDRERRASPRVEEGEGLLPHQGRADDQHGEAGLAPEQDHDQQDRVDRLSREPGDGRNAEPAPVSWLTGE